MFFTECERLAERHPDLAETIQQVDTTLAKMRSDGVIRVFDLASFLQADPNRVRTVLEKLRGENVLRAEEMVECAYCRMPALRSEYERQLEDEGECRCTSCDRPLAEKSVKAITVFRRGEKWKAAPPLPEDTFEKATPQVGALDDEAWYTHLRLAEVFEVGKDALRKRLEKYRSKNMDGWKENEDRRPREPKYLYQLKMIRHVIEALRASSERPAK